MASGGLGGFFYWSLFYPVDVIKSAMMTDRIDRRSANTRGGFLDAGGQLIKQGGIKRLYAGLSAVLTQSVTRERGHAVHRGQDQADARVTADSRGRTRSSSRAYYSPEKSRVRSIIPPRALRTRVVRSLHRTRSLTCI